MEKRFRPLRQSGSHERYFLLQNMANKYADVCIYVNLKSGIDTSSKKIIT